MLDFFVMFSLIATRQRLLVGLVVATLMLAAGSPSFGQVNRCGDCDLDGRVEINELIGAVNNALDFSGPSQDLESDFALPPGYISQTDATSYVVRAAVVDFAEAGFEAGLIRFHAVPHFENRVAVSFRLFGIVAGSLLESLGLVDGDLIVAVNGVPLVNDDLVLELDDLFVAEDLLVDIVRNRVGMTLRWRIDP